MIDVRDVLKTLDGCASSVTFDSRTFEMVTKAMESNIALTMLNIENQFEKKITVSFVFSADYKEHGNKKFLLTSVHSDQYDARLHVAIARLGQIYNKYRILTLSENRFQFLTEYDSFNNQQESLPTGL